MNIVKLGGSIINPDGKYDHTTIQKFIDVVKESNESFIFTVGGGKICRLCQDAAQPFLKAAIKDEKEIDIARDEIGIATTKINARYLLKQFKKELGEQVHPEIILNPNQKIKSNARIFFTCGYKPGHSTDTDMMLIAKTFGATKVFKITNFPKVRNFSPKEWAVADAQAQQKLLDDREEIDAMTWDEFHTLIGDHWFAGMSTPLDPTALKIGLGMKNSLSIYIGRLEEFFKEIKGEGFEGTVVRG